LANFDLLLDAFFLWITFFLAKRSSMDVTRGNNSFASSGEVVFLNFLIALRVVFAWYRFLKRLAALDRILLIADL